MRPGEDTKMMGEQIRFPTTSWNLINIQALDSLIQIYWKPLYFFVRQQGYDNETAKDIVQEFLKTLLERDALKRADPERGHFRTFLPAAMSNFLKDWKRAGARLKRGGDQPIFSLDFVKGETEFGLEVARGESPEEVLNRTWAQSLWRHSVDELRGDPAHLQAFRLYLSDADYPTISRRTGLSESAAKTAVHRLKAQLREIVTEHLRQTGANEEDLKSELAEFISLLR